MMNIAPRVWKVPMIKLGVVTYNIAKDWDLDTLFKRLPMLGFEGVELRTGHAHKVEVGMSPAERSELKSRFDDSPLELAGLGSAFEYQSSDTSVVRRNIEGTKDYIRLAHDIGSPGIKVRPNGVVKGVDPEQTYAQIGRALREVGQDAADFGVEIRVEVHGEVTQLLPNFAKIIANADHSNIYVCWNSNPSDVVQSSIRENFGRVADKIREVHLRDLTDSTYPWRDLFARLQSSEFDGFTLAEIPESSDPERVLRYFRSLWLAYQPTEVKSPR